MKQIVVVGSSNTDMVFRTSKIPHPGETVMGSNFSIVQGGKGANQAVAVARSGGKVLFIAKVGNDDFGMKARAGYIADGINTKSIIIDNENPTGVAVILVDENSGQNSIVVAGGANSGLTVEDIKNHRDSICDASILLAQLEVPIEAVTYALSEAHSAGVRTVLNPAPACQLSPQMLRTVDIITPNETEAEILTGIKPIDFDTAKLAASTLLQSVNEAVLITLGSKGVFYMNKEGDSFIVPAYTVAAVDTTAAGDVFNGYFVTALAAGASARDAIQLGNRAASISVTRRGAQPSIPYLRELI